MEAYRDRGMIRMNFYIENIEFEAYTFSTSILFKFGIGLLLSRLILWT